MGNCGSKPEPSPSSIPSASHLAPAKDQSLSNRDGSLADTVTNSITPRSDVKAAVHLTHDIDSSLDDSIHFKPLDPSIKKTNGPPTSVTTSRRDELAIGASVSARVHPDHMKSIMSELSESSYQGKQYDSMGVIRIDWNEIEIRAASAKEAIIGHGTFGTVVHAIWHPRGGAGRMHERGIAATDESSQSEIEVAVKVLTRSLMGSEEFNISKLYQQACEEVNLVRQAEDRMFDTSRIVHPYGVAKGLLTAEMCKIFRIQEGEDGIGIVMRFEGGGSLENLVHSNRKTAEPLSMTEKIRLLFEISKGLAELHASGIVHADIKLDNVLLSHHRPPKVRLADFGLSIFRKDDEQKLGNSSLKMTSHLRGTPIFCAPELLTNPFEISKEGVVAKPSRKTDMYAFGILCWELLSQGQPFGDVRTEGELCSKVHQGVRPPLSDIPPDTPPSLVRMIKQCWDKNRNIRKTAVECVSILQYEYVKRQKIDFDIYFSHAAVPKLLLSHIFHYFIRLGYNVCSDSDQTTELKSELMLSSQVVIVCFDKDYQNSPTCLKALEELREKSPNKTILTLVVEEKLMAWANERAKQVCALQSETMVDIGHIGRAHWNSEEGPDAAMLVALTKNLEPLKQLVTAAGCVAVSDFDTTRLRSVSQVSKPTSNVDKTKTNKILAGLELCVAVYEGDLNYLRGLLESGCPVNAADYDFRTAAHICCAENLVQAALVLYEFHADFSSDAVKDRWGRTPLEEAENHNHVHLAAILRSLIESDKQKKAEMKESASLQSDKQDCVGLELCVAAFQGDEHYLRALLESGCPVGAADYDRRTAAHISCAENNMGIVLILNEFNADFTSDKVKDRFGVTPLMEAENHGHHELATTIRNLVQQKEQKKAEALARAAEKKKQMAASPLMVNA